MSKSPVTCHILDSSTGKPAPEVRVSLVSLSNEEGNVSELAQGVTDSDGRCSTLLSPDTKLKAGIYKMTFFTGPYFAATETKTFYPFVEITFNYENPSQHYHIPLLISPFSYTTYRGS